MTLINTAVGLLAISSPFGVRPVVARAAGGDDSRLRQISRMAGAGWAGCHLLGGGEFTADLDWTPRFERRVDHAGDGDLAHLAGVDVAAACPGGAAGQGDQSPDGTAA